MIRKLFFLGLFVLGVSGTCVYSQPDPKPPLPSNGKTNSNGIVLGDPQNAVNDLNTIFRLLNTYKARHEGALPSEGRDLVQDIALNSSAYGFKNYAESKSVFTNPDYQLTGSDISKEVQEKTWVYRFNLKRTDGSLLQGERPLGTRDALAWTNLYFYRNFVYSPEFVMSSNPVGFYMVLWDDGKIEKIPYDLAYFYEKREDTYSEVFPNQVNTVFNSLSFGEMFGSSSVDLGKPTPGPGEHPVEDNGGPEGLIQLSRRQAFPDAYGVERDQLWKILSPSQTTFTLQQLQECASKLGMDAQSLSL